MSKPMIAIDIDNVLAIHAEVLMDYYNEQYGTHFTALDYDESWQWMDGDEERMNDFKTKFPYSGKHGLMEVVAGAHEALAELSKRYRLVIITARWEITREITLRWVNTHFKGIFEDVYLAQTLSDDGKKVTKAEICKQIGAEYLVDDNISHCKLAGEAGIHCVLFGEYTWNKTDEPFANVIRCKGWAAVKAYFDGR